MYKQAVGKKTVSLTMRQARDFVRRRPTLWGAVLLAALLPTVALAQGLGNFVSDSRVRPFPAVTAEAPFDVGVKASGTVGVSATGTNVGVTAIGTNGPGLKAESRDPNGGNGVEARGLTGVLAVGKQERGSNGAGIVAFGDVAVVARGTRSGVDATATGIAVRGSGEYGGAFVGGKAPILLVPATTVGAPKTGAHLVGELYVDKNGELFFCRTSGSPGLWKKVRLE